MFKVTLRHVSILWNSAFKWNLYYRFFFLFFFVLLAYALCWLLPCLFGLVLLNICFICLNFFRVLPYAHYRPIVILNRQLLNILILPLCIHPCLNKLNKMHLCTGNVFKMDRLICSTKDITISNMFQVENPTLTFVLYMTGLCHSCTLRKIIIKLGTL